MCFHKGIVKTILWSCILTFIVDACFIDLCTMLPADFCEGRQCRMKSDCWTYECYCDENSTYPTCLNGSVDCPCLHGYCNTTDTNTTECVCLSGYRGQNCTEIQCPFDSCEDECPGQDCRTMPDCTHECYCDENSTKCYPDANSSALAEHNPCFDNFTFRSFTERTCDSELTCLYGRCVNDNGSFVCKCDGEATGLQCQYPCCLDCGQYGECSYTELQEEYCNCSHNYTGDNCEISTPQYNPCYDNFTMRTFRERSCNGGLVCTYGKCVSEGKISTCVCDPGADGIICQNQCCMNCGKGQCKYSDTLESEYCNCPFKLTGERCEGPSPGYGPEEVITWHLWVVGACAVVLIVLIVLMVVIPYLMWKHRNILLMKLVYYFQKYEDDDEREWDAFVSYRSLPRDESFVVHQLYPKLETEMGFKLNLHFRDFIPGDTIANNIIRAVKGSRRTILIITPGYLQSEHTMFEFYVAQQAMLDRKHRIIPVLLEDISDFKIIMDENLKTVLSSITYLEWPKEILDTKKIEKFWKRLQLSLPKKRPNSDSNKSSPTESVVADDIEVSVEPMKSKLINGSVYSNKGFQQDPETDYATINECDIDQNGKAEEKYVTIEDFETNVEGYMKMLDPVSTC